MKPYSEGGDAIEVIGVIGPRAGTNVLPGKTRAAVLGA